MSYFFLCLCAALIALAPSGRAAGVFLDAPVSYSATRNVTVDGKPYTGRAFHVPGRERHEQTLLGMDEVVILDAAAAQGFLVLPSVKTYAQFAFPPIFAELLDPALPKDAVGDESIDGRPATKYRVAKTAPDGTHGDGFIWLDRHGVLMKLVATVTAPGGRRSHIEAALSGLKEGAQAAALFQPPANYAQLPPDALAPLLNMSLR